MKNGNSDLLKEFSAEQVAKLDGIIARYKGKPGGLIPVDAPGRGLQPCVEGGQHKAAAFFQRLLRQQIELGQRVRRIRLRHPEIWP